MPRGSSGGLQLSQGVGRVARAVSIGGRGKENSVFSREEPRGGKQDRRLGDEKNCTDWQVGGIKGESEEKSFRVPAVSGFVGS